MDTTKVPLEGGSPWRWFAEPEPDAEYLTLARFIQLRSVVAVEGEGLGAPLAWSEDLRRLHAEMAEGPDARAS